MESNFNIRKANALALAYIRKESFDIFNRLHSILEDVRFVEQVHEAYPGIPILPNLRCGAWYVDPEIATHEPAYFKSTDGHFGNWSFNLRRPNLHLLPLIVAKHGLLLVDSTRAGKRIPDALSKTVPIWCAVINRATRLLYPNKKDWDVELYCPPGAVSEQERSQMSARLDGWAEALAKSAYILPDLPCPLRPLWITPSTSVFPQLPAPYSLQYLPIICVSASKRIHDGIERRSNGFSYVQGSGDDHELWGMGLTPQLFWSNQSELVDSDRDHLQSVVARVVERSKMLQNGDTWKTHPTPITAVNGRILIGAVSDMPSELPKSLPGVDDPVSFVIVSSNVPVPRGDDDVPREDKNILRLRLAEGKKDQIAFLQSVLPTSTSFIEKRLALGERVCVCCDSGKDASVGIVLAILQMLFDAEGRMLEQGTQASLPSKESIRTRLQWIISSRPQANPSRVTLKRVNEFLLSSPSFRRK